MKHIYSKHIKGSKLTRLKTSVRGVVIHNDYGSMTPSQYENWLYKRESNGTHVNGFASIYANRNECLWYHPTDYVEWHCANQWANYNLIGIEVCESYPGHISDEVFIQNEEACFKIAADVLKSYNLPVNQDTVNLHREFFATSCPHRSWDIHVGKNTPNTRNNQLKLLNYFISRIKYYYNEETQQKTSTKVKEATSVKEIKFNFDKDYGRREKSYLKGTIDNLGAEVRNRKGSQKSGFNWNTKAGLTLKPGEEVYVFEIHDGWCRIYTSNIKGTGSNRWVWHERINVTKVY